jgi:hypothetical protein
VGKHASLLLCRLGDYDITAIAGHAIRKYPAQTLAFDPKHLLHLPDLANEKPAPLLRQKR